MIVPLYMIEKIRSQRSRGGVFKRKRFIKIVRLLRVSTTDDLL